MEFLWSLCGVSVCNFHTIFCGVSTQFFHRIFCGIPHNIFVRAGAGNELKVLSMTLPDPLSPPSTAMALTSRHAPLLYHAAMYIYKTHMIFTSYHASSTSAFMFCHSKPSLSNPHSIIYIPIPPHQFLLYYPPQFLLSNLLHLHLHISSPRSPRDRLLPTI